VKKLTVFLMSGDAATILAALGASEQPSVLPFSEKDLTTPKATLKRLRDVKGDIAIGTKVLRLQRYRLVLKTLLFLSGKWAATMIDESGETERYSAIQFIFVDCWKLLAEILASLFIVTETYLELESLKRKTNAFTSSQ